MRTAPKYPPTTDDIALVRRLIAACGGIDAVAARTAVGPDKSHPLSGKTIARVITENTLEAACTPKTRAILELTEREVIQVASAPAPPSHPDLDARPVGAEQLREMMIIAQQPKPAISMDAFCNLCCSRLRRIDSPTLDWNVAAILMAQIGLLRGMGDRLATFRQCQPFLQDMAETPQGEYRDLFQILARTSLGRAQTIRAAQETSAARRIELLESARTIFQGIGCYEPRQFPVLPLPLIWTAEEHPTWEVARGDVVARTPLTRYSGRPHRYLLWVSLTLAFEYLASPQHDYPRARRRLTEAEEHAKQWRDTVVRLSPSESIQLAFQAWMIRLHCLQYLLSERMGDQRLKKQAAGAIDHYLPRLPLLTSPNFLTDVEALSVEALLKSKPDNILHNPAMIIEPLKKYCDSAFLINRADMQLLPLTRIYQLSPATQGVREVMALFRT